MCIHRLGVYQSCQAYGNPVICDEMFVEKDSVGLKCPYTVVCNMHWGRIPSLVMEMTLLLQTKCDMLSLGWPLRYSEKEGNKSKSFKQINSIQLAEGNWEGGGTSLFICIVPWSSFKIKAGHKCLTGNMLWCLLTVQARLESAQNFSEYFQNKLPVVHTALTSLTSWFSVLFFSLT